MKVLLKQDMDNLGRMGEVVEVAGGYARNYLIPRGLAIGVTRGRLKEIEEKRRVLEAKAERERERLESVADKIESLEITIKARCSASGKLFGSVTNRQLAAEIESLTGEEVDRHKIVVDEKIRMVGDYKATIKLHPDVALEMDFKVEGEGFVEEEPTEAGEREEDREQASEQNEGVTGDNGDETAERRETAETEPPEDSGDEGDFQPSSG